MTEKPDTDETLTETTEVVDTEDAATDAAQEHTEDTEPDTFPREYVENLRKENADYRTRAKTADDLAKRLHTELVRATGKLADPTDLPFDAAHLDDPDTLAAAVDALIEAKPHLKARKVTGNVGQGESGGSAGVDLLSIMRGQT